MRQGRPFPRIFIRHFSSKNDDVTVAVSQIVSSSPSAAAEIVEKYLAESNNEPQGESLLVESQSSMEGCDETESLEAKYYHIDTLVNKVMRLKFELNQTSLKRQETIRNLEKAKERLNFLNRPNPSSLILVEAFHKETLENYRRLLSRIKAIDESLVNLQRQYDDTLCQAENEKRNFLKTRQSDSELLPEVEIPIQSKVSKYSTFSPSELLTRDRWTQIGDNTNTDSSDTEHGDLTTEMDSKKEEESVRISLEEAEGRLFDWTKSFELEIPQTILDQCTLDRCSVCGVSHSTLENALRHYNSKRHKKAIQKLLKLKTENDRYVYIKPPRNQHDSYKRMSSLDNKEAEMRDLWEKHTDAEYRVDRPWLTEDVTKFVSQSVQDFQTLLKWLEDLQSEEKWDSWKINDITYGLGKLLFYFHQMNSISTIFLGKIHSNLVNNLQRIEKDYKYVKYNRQYVGFVEEFVRKPEQFMLQAARTSVNKLEELHTETVAELARPVTINERLDLSVSAMWKSVNKEREKLRDIKDKLFEVENHEERVAELDDWREDPKHFTSPNLSQILTKIDEQNQRISKFTRDDINNKWKLVDKNLKKLQLLRAQVGRNFV